MSNPDLSGSKLEPGISPLERLYRIADDAANGRDPIGSDMALARLWRVQWIAESTDFEFCEDFGLDVPILFLNYVARRTFGMIPATPKILEFERKLAQTYLDALPLINASPLLRNLQIAGPQQLSILDRLREILELVKSTTYKQPDHVALSLWHNGMRCFEEHLDPSISYVRLHFASYLDRREKGLVKMTPEISAFEHEIVRVRDYLSLAAETEMG